MHAILAPIAPAATPAVAGTNPRRELARYTLSTGQRTIYGQRVDGRVRVTDVGEGRNYLIDSGIESTAALNALIADYLQQAEQHDACPMAHSLLASTLAQLA